jgi:taurine transport system substrate-binding protein
MKSAQRGIGIAMTIGLLGIAVLTAVTAESQELPKVVRISWFGSAGPWILAKANGDFDRNIGTQVKWDQYQAGGEVLTALAADQVDISLLGSPPTVGGLIRGLPIEVIALEGVLATSEQLIVRDNIKIPADLKGKRIAFPPGSSSQYGLFGAMKIYKLGKEDVTLIGLSPANMVAAWKRGDIDGGFVWNPFCFEMEKDGGHALLTLKDVQEGGFFVWQNFVVRKAFASQYPGVVVKFLETYQTTLDAYRNDPKTVVKKIAAHLNQTEQLVESTMAGREYYDLKTQLGTEWLGDTTDSGKSRIMAGLTDTANFLSTVGQFSARDIPPSFGTYVNNAFMKKAAK